MVLMSVEVVDDEAWCAELTPEERRWMLKQVEQDTQIQLVKLIIAAYVNIYRAIDGFYEKALADLSTQDR